MSHLRGQRSLRQVWHLAGIAFNATIFKRAIKEVAARFPEISVGVATRSSDQVDANFVVADESDAGANRNVAFALRWATLRLKREPGDDGVEVLLLEAIGTLVTAAVIDRIGGEVFASLSGRANDDSVSHAPPPQRRGGDPA
jgi:hypothetical protein